MVTAVRTERGPEGLEVVKQADTDHDRARLREEAAWLQRGAHPGVVEVVGTGPGVLRLRHRGTALARLGSLAPDTSAAIVRAIADVVDSLHDQGIVHTRIDAGHVLIGDRGRPRLCGFSAATEADDALRAADVADLGRLLDDLLDAGKEAMWSPPHRGVRNSGRRKRALAAFRSAAAAARRDDPAQRPTARQFATALREAFPDLALPDGPETDEDARAFAEIPHDFDPTSELGWTDDDLWYLATSDDHQDDDDEPVRRRDPYAELAALATPDDEADDRPPTRTGDHEADPTSDDQGEDDDAERWARFASSPPSGRDDASGEHLPDALAPIVLRPPSPSSPDDRRARHRRRPSRKALLVVALVVLALGAVAGALIAREIWPFGDDDPAATTSTSAAAGADDETPAPTPPTYPSRCDVPTLPGPDVDGDGCPEAVSLSDRVATVGSVSIVLGQDGDLVTLADTDCDGVVTPVLYRPSSGEVFVFPRWSLDEPMTVQSSAEVPEGRSVGTGAGPCGPVVVTDHDGNETVVTGPGS